MGEPRSSFKPRTLDDAPAWRVIDDFPDGYPVAEAELDAVEAFLMPLVSSLLPDASAIRAEEPLLAPTDAPIHKQVRRAEAASRRTVK